MSNRSQTRSLLRQNRHPEGRPLSKEEREQLVQPFLPTPPGFSGSKERPGKVRRSSEEAPNQRTTRDGRKKWQRPRVRHVTGLLLQKTLFFLIQLIFSIYIHARQTCHAVLSQIFSILYYHHRSPELIQRDVRGLCRLPKHLSIIVDLDNGDGSQRHAEALSKLIDDVAEVCAWCTCAGIPMLSVYERTGALKPHIPSLHRDVTRTLNSYFPPGSVPAVKIRAPHLSAYSPPDDPDRPSQFTASSLNVLVLSATDGRETLVDLTKTLAEMSQQGKLQSLDITSDLIDAEVTESSCGEPDMLVLMAPSASNEDRARRRRRDRKKVGAKLDEAGSSTPEDDAATQLVGGADGGICLRGYPPWQVRLTEIFHTQDSSGVEYQAFLRALYKFAQAEMRFGR